MTNDIYDSFRSELEALAQTKNKRELPDINISGKWIYRGKERMLNLSSNDYLGLASDYSLRDEFLEVCKGDDMIFSASSSRLLTGNFPVYIELENLLSSLFGTESALVFNCGYHANTGILPAVADENTLILADKLIHASLIDGLKLCQCKSIRFRHNNYEQLERLLHENQNKYTRIIIVVESVYSMDGDCADLKRLVALKREYPNVMLYVDEAHGVGVFGETGLGLAEQEGCIGEIDFLMGTFGKALASSGAYLVCRKVIRDYLLNKMRPFIFTTANAPVNIAWTKFIMERLNTFSDRRKHLALISGKLIFSIKEKGIECVSQSQIIPLIAGESAAAVALAEQLQKKGFYILPVRPPTVPQGTSRLRFSLNASITDQEMDNLIKELSLAGL